MFISTCLHSMNTSGEQGDHATEQESKDKHISLAELITYYLYLKFCLLLCILIHVDMFVWKKAGV